MEQTLQIWAVIGTWVASIGTVLAVITSLWLAYNQNRVKLKVTAGHGVLISQESDIKNDYCYINVVNTGSRPARVTNVAWEAGRYKSKQFMVQRLGDANSDCVPKMLTEGEEANFLIPFEDTGKNEDWPLLMAKTLTEKRNNISSLKAIISTSTGQQFKVSVEPELKEKLAETLKTNKKMQPIADATAD